MMPSSKGEPPTASFLPTGFLDNLSQCEGRTRFNLLLLEHGEVYFGTSSPLLPILLSNSYPPPPSTRHSQGTTP